MKICIYFKEVVEVDRFFPGDRFLRPIVRNLTKRQKVGGVQKVFLNLCSGFQALSVPILVNPPFRNISSEDAVIVLGTGRHVLEGYTKLNKIIAGIGLMTHPSQWPDLCKEYPVEKYLQHCNWAANIYKPYFGEAVCDIWFAGIDTERWQPKPRLKKKTILIYNKIRWDYENIDITLRLPILKLLEDKGYEFKEVIYGKYQEQDYYNLLSESSAMIFLCEHESQGFACCEAMSMNIPVFAWDQGFCLDPNRYVWGTETIPATSVPFFDERCGMRFIDFQEFELKFVQFISHVTSGYFSPRTYIQENLTLEKSVNRMLEIISEVYK